jgi:hypothetical protein
LWLHDDSWSVSSGSRRKQRRRRGTNKDRRRVMRRWRRRRRSKNLSHFSIGDISRSNDSLTNSFFE